jgi:hypothetical protein
MLKTATIANAATTSDEVALENGASPLGLIFPAAFTGATVTLKSRWDSTVGAVTVQSITGGSDYTVTVAVGKYVPLDPRIVKGIRNLTIVSSGAEAAARSIGVVFDPLA